MVGTLVISLPVAGTGGELVIRHKQNEAVIDLRTEDPSELAFAAFYADCVHETRPVATGHRIVLVYQLLLRGGDHGGLERAPDYDVLTERIAALLAQWDRSTQGAEKIVWLLEHEYSEEGLSFSALKNTDAAVARTLAEAARRADCALYAAILHIEESCAAEYPQDLPYGVDLDDSDLEAGEVLDSEHWLDDWVAPDDVRPEYGKLPLRARELLPVGALDDADPDDESVNEATGNAGVEIERAYRSAALVLWPRARTVATLAGAGIGSSVAYVAEELERNDHSEAAHGRLRDLATQLIDAWPAPPPGRRTDVERSCRAALRLLCRLGDQSITLRFLHDVTTAIYSGGLNAELAAVVTPAALRDWLPEFIDANLLSRTDGVIDLVWRLILVPAEGQDAELARRTAQRHATPVADHLRRPGAADQRPRESISAPTSATRGRRHDPQPVGPRVAFRSGSRGGRSRGTADRTPGSRAARSDAAGGAGGTCGPAAAPNGSPGVQGAVAPCRRLPAGKERAAARGTERLGAGGLDFVSVPALPRTATVLRRPAGESAAASAPQGTAPASPRDHRR